MKAKMRFLAKKILKNQNQKANTLYQDKKINHFLFSCIKQIGAKKVLLYQGMKHEVDLSFLAKKLRKGGISVFIPQIKDQKMEITPLSLPLRYGKYGIKESSLTKPYTGDIDVAIVPILGFDSAFRRVGFGMGYYDRFFTTKLHKPYIIFASRVLIFSKQIITNQDDIKADMIVSGRTLREIDSLRNDDGNF